MKKIMTVMCAALALTAGLLVSGCEVADEFTGKDTWLERDFDYTDKNSETSSVECYFYYSDSAYTNAKLKTDVSMPAGLTVVVVPKSGTTLYTELGIDPMFLYKNFPKSDTATIDDANDGETAGTGTVSFKPNDTLWSAFYLYYTSNGKLTKTEIPTAVKTDGNYTMISDSTNFSWKKMLTQILVGKVLGE